MTASDTQPATGARTLVDFAYADLAHELVGVRRHLERVPDDRLDWRPHEKSKSLGELATHLAQAPGLSYLIVALDEFDMATGPRPPRTLPNRDAMLAEFDAATARLADAMAALDDAALARTWTMRRGDLVLLSRSKGQLLRTLGISHFVHHRAQLGVYLRLSGVAVPGVYGPSADE
jgi:uncharacterized damage-inducible protein DinB